MRAATKALHQCSTGKTLDASRERYLKDCLTLKYSVTTKKELSVLSTKELYTLFVEKILIPPTAYSKLKNNFELNQNEINWSFQNFHRIIMETKLKDFQFRCLHYIVNTKYKLKKMGITQDDTCSFCNLNTETYNHLFFDCLKVQIFWMNFKHFWTSTFHENISLDLKEIVIGYKERNDLFNYLIILGKWYIYQCSKKGTTPVFFIFKALCKSKYNIELNIARKNNQMADFNRKWKFLVSYL